VIYSMSGPRIVLLSVIGMASVGLFAGCSELSSSSYPRDLRYPLRNDLLVTTQPAGFADAQPWRPSPPGALDQELNRLAKDENTKQFFADPAKLDAADRKELRDALREVFGTPYAPSVEPLSKVVDDVEQNENRLLYDQYLARQRTDLEVTDDAITALNLELADLKQGSKHYRRHCLHCHGLSGDGRGPTGPWVNPHPRDYRQGKFKFVSTNLAVGEKKPRRADLLRTISTGIESSSMPAFGLLPEKELEELVSYVIHLSIRGQVEYATMKTLLTEGGKSNLEKQSIRENVYFLATLILCQWADASQKGANTPPNYTAPANKEELNASIVRGYKIFTNAEGAASCIACHLDFGRQVPYRYDDWGTLVRPANLTAGVYRGGRRPVDLYWRITDGIAPSQMPGAKLKEQEVWDLVNFVHYLPYPAMLPDEVRDRIYVQSTVSEAHAARRPEGVPGG
jgi:mono/diheme cytochrome c family protein